MNDEIKVQIIVSYTCIDCGLINKPVKVDARGEEDVEAWLYMLGCALSKDHKTRSPNCHPKTLADVRIPTNGTDRIGGPTIN